MTNSEISQWIDNDEGLYNWWRSTRPRQSKTAFIKANRPELVNAINNVTSGRKQAHYLAYGPDAVPRGVR